MRILSLAHARTRRRPGIPALVAVALLVSLLALPAAATDHVRRQGLGHAYLVPPTLAQAQER